MKVSAEIDISGLQKALAAAAKVSSRTTAEVINSAARDIIFRSAEKTRKANRHNIETKLTRAVYTVTKTKTGRLLKKAKTLYQSSELVYRLVNAKRRQKGQAGVAGMQMSQEAQKFVKRHINAIGYIAYAGWNKALQAFGGRGFGTGKTGKIKANSFAARGYGRPARPELLLAEFVNRATKAFEIGGAVTQGIVSQKETEIYLYLEQKLGSEFKRI